MSCSDDTLNHAWTVGFFYLSVKSTVNIFPNAIIDETAQENTLKFRPQSLHNYHHFLTSL